MLRRAMMTFARPQVAAAGRFPRLATAEAARAFGSVSGTVKFFNPEKGFGFIAAEGKEYFVHYSGIASPGFKSLADGEEVEFDVEEDRNSGKARAVRVTGPGGAPVRGSQRQRYDEEGM